MFWKYNAGACSHLETLLSKEDVTLEEVLDEEDIVQECRVQNKKLIDFLMRPDILERLVSLTTEEPSTEIEEKHRFRHPNIACELLTCDVPQLNERLAGNEALLVKLYSFLQNPNPLNPLLASFFSKTLTGLVTRRAEQVLEFLKNQEDAVGLLLQHLGTSAIMDLLQRLITGVEGNDMRKNVLSWLDGQNVIQRIIQLMGPETDPERHCNASQLLLDVIRISRDNFGTSPTENGGPDPILERLESPETASTVLDLMLSGGDQRSESAIVGGVAVLLTLLETSRIPADDSSEKNEDRESFCQSNICKAMVPRLKDLHDVLLNPPKKAAIKTTAEHLDPPFGNTRLQICRLISALIATQDVEVLSTLAELGTFSVLLDLFFTYKWNNFLHSQVEYCITLLLQRLPCSAEATFNQTLDKTTTKSPGSSPSTPPAELADAGDGDKTEAAESTESAQAVDVDVKSGVLPVELNPLLINLFGESRLLGRIIEAYKNDEDGSLSKLRCGYFGHLVHISNCIAEHVTDDILERLVPSEETRHQWMDLLEGQISRVNKIQSEFLGGQHPSKIIESEDNDYPIIPFSQDESVLQNFTELLSCYKSAPFTDGASYDDNQFFDGDDVLQQCSLDDIRSREDMFSDMCKEKSGIDEDDFERELNFNSPTSANPPILRFVMLPDESEIAKLSVVRTRRALGSDDSDEEEHPNLPAAAAAAVMEVDNVDPWADSAEVSVAAAVSEEDPWGSSDAPAEKESNDQGDGWANFCAFSATIDAAIDAAEVKDLENNRDREAAESASEDTNANPPFDVPDENSELVDNYRFLSQGLMSADGAVAEPSATPSDTSAEPPLAEQPQSESQEIPVSDSCTNTSHSAEGEGSI